MIIFLLYRLPNQCEHFLIRPEPYFNSWINIKKVSINKKVRPHLPTRAVCYLSAKFSKLTMLNLTKLGPCIGRQAVLLKILLRE